MAPKSTSKSRRKSQKIEDVGIVKRGVAKKRGKKIGTAKVGRIGGIKKNGRKTRSTAARGRKTSSRK